MHADKTLEDMIDQAVSGGELEAGVPAKVVAAHAGRALSEEETALAAGNGRGRGAPWSPEDEGFVQNHLGKVSLADIGQALGRSENAIKILYTRRGWAAPSKQPGELSARIVGLRLGKCGKSVKALIQAGILPGRRVPGGRNIHVVTEVALYTWAVSPKDWIYFKNERVQDGRLRRLLALKRERWDDEWLTTGQVAAMHDLPGGSSDVTRHIYAGKLPAMRYTNWWVLRSDAEAHHFKIGRGKGHELEWPPAADAFLILARAVGVSATVTDRLMKSPAKRAQYRLRRLHAGGKIPGLIEGYRLGVKYGGVGTQTPIVFVDWRKCPDRFPTIEAAAVRLKARRHLRPIDVHTLTGVLGIWAIWHACDDPRMEPMARAIAHPGRDPRGRFFHVWLRMRTLKIDPFAL